MAQIIDLAERRKARQRRPVDAFAMSVAMFAIVTGWLMIAAAVSEAMFRQAAE